MYKLSNKNTGVLIGEIDDTQLQFLIDELVEESPDDQDYFLNREMMAALEGKVESFMSLIGMLKNALGDEVDLEIVWTE